MRSGLERRRDELLHLHVKKLGVEGSSQMVGTQPSFSDPRGTRRGDGHPRTESNIDTGKARKTFCKNFLAKMFLQNGAGPSPVGGATLKCGRWPQNEI